MAKDTIKCHWCKKEVKKSEAVTYKHQTEERIYYYKGHKTCCERWVNDYNLFGEIRDLLLNIFSIEKLTKTMVKMLRSLRETYSYSLILEAIQSRKSTIQVGVKKGWHYVFAIIENRCAQLYSLDQQLKEQLQLNEPTNISIQISAKTTINTKRKKIDTTDYSTLLD
jgi:hypothetical protein